MEAEVIGVLGLAVALAAETPTLDDVLASVDRHHPALLAARAEADAASGARLGAAGWFDPTVRATALWRTGPYDQTTALASVTQQTPLYGLEVTAGYRVGLGKFPAYEGWTDTLDGGALFADLRLPLLKGGLTDPERTGVAVARLDEQAAQARAELERVVLGRDARAAYWKWAASGEKQAIAARARQVAETSAYAVRREVDLGDAAPIEEVDARRVVVERQGKETELGRDVDAAAWKVGLYLRDAEGTPRPLIGLPPPPLPRPTEADLPLEAEAEAEALRSRPDLAWLQAKREAAAAKARLASIEVLPKLDLKVGLEQDLPGEGEDAEPFDLKIGGELTFPLLLRPGRGKQVEAQGLLAAADAKLAWARDKVLAEVRTAHAVANAAHRQALLADETARLAREVEDATRRRWELGDTDLFSLYLREQSTLKAALEAADAWGAFHAAVADLNAAIGRR